MHGDIVPGRNLIGNLGMWPIPVRRDIGIRTRHDEKGRGRKTSPRDRVGAGKVQFGETCIIGQMKRHMCGKRAIGAVHRQDAKAPGTGESQVPVKGSLAKGGVGVHGPDLDPCRPALVDQHLSTSTCRIERHAPQAFCLASARRRATGSGQRAAREYFRQEERASRRNDKGRQGCPVAAV